MDAQLAMLLSASAHAAFLVAACWSVPSLDEQSVDSTRAAGTFALIHAYLDAPAEPEEESPRGDPRRGYRR